MMDVLYKYNRRGKWKRGRVSKIMVGKNTMCKVHVFAEEAKVINWEERINGMPTTKKISGWFFMYWIPIQRVKFI